MNLLLFARVWLQMMSFQQNAVFTSHVIAW